MEIRLLRTFRAVAGAGSFTAAAHQLGYVQSSVTAQIKTLERQAGGALFERLGRRVALTDAGRELLGYAERILRLTDEAAEAVSSVAGGTDEVAGTLYVGALETLCTYRLPAVLGDLGARFPRLRVVFRPAGRGELLAEMSAARLDAAFLLDEPFTVPGLATERLVDEPMVLVAAPGHPLAGHRAVGPADLADQPLIMQEEGCPQRVVFERELRAAGVLPHVLAEFVSLEAVKRCVAAGLGVSAVPLVGVTAELDRGELVRLPWPRTDLNLHTQAVVLARRQPGPALTALLTTARTHWSR